MQLKTLSLFDFRNHREKRFEFGEQNIVFFGNNGKGKTNILEAISVLSVGKSWREKQPVDLIRKGESSAKIMGNMEDNAYQVLIEEKNRTIFRNEKKVSLKSHIGAISTLLFCPEFLGLFSGNKRERQKFFDRFLFQISPNYRENLTRANQAHKQKTRLLRQGFERVVSWDEIHPWNTILSETVPKVVSERESFVKDINPIFQEEFSKISGTSQDSVEIKLELKEEVSSNQKSCIEWLETNFNRECAAQKNFISPLRDDFSFFIRSQPILQTASRGEERSVLLALLSAKKHFLNHKMGVSPILLLDDVFSELDDNRQKQLETLCEGSQAFITTTHQEHFDRFSSPIQKFEIL
ncbi:DNA replication/repair protein RecF [Candidatus Gracilibacteria bacterium]|nr:DNA replication/repair protein RecF [Candidatus Gracilibacteria bacterium]